MKKFILFSLIMAGLLFGQTRLKQVYYETISTTGATTIDTDEWSILDLTNDRFDFKGRLDPYIRVKNVKGAGDSIAVIPHYKIGREWHTGDTTVWSLAETDAEYSTTKTYLAPQSGDSLLLYVVNVDPTESSIKGWAWDTMYWTIVILNASSFTLEFGVGPY